MTTVFLKVISGILQQHEELLRKYKKKALTLKDYDGIFLKAHTTNGRTYFTGHRPGKKPKYIGNEKHTTVQRIQNLRATKVLNFDAGKSTSLRSNIFRIITSLSPRKKSAKGFRNVTFRRIFAKRSRYRMQLRSGT